MHTRSVRAAQRVASIYSASCDCFVAAHTRLWQCQQSVKLRNVRDDRAAWYTTMSLLDFFIYFAVYACV